MTSLASQGADTSAWWAAHRLRYNAGLLAAGLLGFVLYVVVVSLACGCEPEAEVTLFTTAFQAVGYLVAVAAANVCFQLGPVVERRFRPRDVGAYRHRAFWAGFWFSVALPLLVPVLAYIGCRCGAPGQLR